MFLVARGTALIRDEGDVLTNLDWLRLQVISRIAFLRALPPIVVTRSWTLKKFDSCRPLHRVSLVFLP